MKPRVPSLTIALLSWLLSSAYAQTGKAPQDSDTPDYRIQVWGDIAVEFSTRMSSYVELRSELEKGLPPLTVTDRPEEIGRAERALARRIRSARMEAKQGDIFTPAITLVFRKALRAEMDAKTWAAIMDENPGEFSARINGTYPEDKPLSTVPPNILAALPNLPDDVQYRFMGRHLMLFDVRARVLLDQIPDAIECIDTTSNCYR
jgi:hypothetical protein